MQHNSRAFWGLLSVFVLTACAANPTEGQVTSHPQAPSQALTVQHIRIVSDQSFADVRQNLKTELPKLDVSIFKALREGDQSRVADYEKNGPALSIFLERDHVALLQITGQPREAVRYEIGNPVTATKMIPHQLAAALYAPLRVVLYENERGNGVFEYDKPSSQFGQYGEADVTEVARRLDASIEGALRKAAGESSAQPTATIIKK
jgi:uncharacterized protein (DUF302 family)